MALDFYRGCFIVIVLKRRQTCQTVESATGMAKVREQVYRVRKPVKEIGELSIAGPGV